MESRDIEFDHLPNRPTTALKGRQAKALQVVINSVALDRVHAHGKTTRRVEVCGVLLGDVYHDGVGPYLHIEAAVEGISAHGGAGQVTFTSAAWAHIHSTIDRDYAHLRIVGWYHTHPGHGIFLSGADLFLHENFFGLPWQVAFVHDPKSDEDGMFLSIDGAIQRITFSIESNASEVSTTLNIEALPKMAPVEAPPIKAPKPKKAKPLLPARTTRHARTTGKVILALFGLVLYTATGLLTGLLIQQLHWHLPQWPAGSWPG